MPKPEANKNWGRVLFLPTPDGPPMAPDALL